MSTLVRRVAARLAGRVGRFLLDGLALGRGVRLAEVFFFELRARTFAAFFFDVFLADDREDDFFLVTFFAASLRFLEGLAALVTFFLLTARFLVDVFFLVGAFFFTRAFFDDRDAGRLRELRFAVFFDAFFLAAAFRFGITQNPQVAPNEAGDYT